MRSRPFENSSGPWLPKRALFILLTLAITLVGTPYIPSAAAVTQCVIKWVEINQNGVNSVDKTVYSGEMLNANAPAFTSGYSSAVFTYSWISSTRGLVATGSSYRPVTADIGSTLLVNASLRCSSPGSYSDSNAGSTGLVASGVPTLSVYQPTQLVAAPTLQETSIASSSAITARQWQRADTSSGTFSNIGGATSTRYKVTITDFNKFIRIVTTYADATTRTSNPVQYLVFDTNSSWTVPTGVSQAYISMTAGVGGFPSINDTATHWTSESSSALSSGRIGGLVSISTGQQLQYYQGSHGNPPSSTNYGGLGGTANLTGSGLTGYAGGAGGSEYSSGGGCSNWRWAGAGGAAASVLQIRASDNSLISTAVAGGGGGHTGQANEIKMSPYTGCQTQVFGAPKGTYTTDTIGQTAGNIPPPGNRGSNSGGGGGGAHGGAAGDYMSGTGLVLTRYVGTTGENSTGGITGLTATNVAWTGDFGYPTNTDGTYSTMPTSPLFVVLYAVPAAMPQSVTWVPTNTSVRATQSPITPNTAATSSSTGSITYSVVSNSTTTCSVDATTGALTFTGSGNCVVRATAAATSTALEGTKDVTFTVARDTQTVTWNPTTTLTTTQSGNLPSVNATGLGSPPITYSVVSGFTTTTCSVDTSTGALTYTGSGSCTIRATATQTSTYNTAAVDVTFSVSLAPQVITWDPSTTLAANASPSLAVSASALGSPLVTFSKVSNTNTSCTVDSGTGVLTFSGVGECVVRASTNATSMYAAGSRDRTFTIARGTPVATWAPTLGLVATAGSETFSAASFSNTTGAVSYVIDNAGSTGCSLTSSSSRVLSFTGAGSCSVTATVAETADFVSVSTTKTFAIGRAIQTITWAPSTGLNGASTSVTMSAATSSGNGSISYSVTNNAGAGCVVTSPSSPTMTFTSAGSCTITAAAQETTLFAAATNSAIFTVAAATPTLSWTPTTTLAITHSPATPSLLATSTSLGSVSYAVTNSGTTGCTVNAGSGVITYTALGNCEITATSLASSLYASGAVAVTFSINRAPQTITLQSSSLTITTGGAATLSSTGFTGIGIRTYSLVSGSACVLIGTRLTTRASGTCVVEVSIAQDDAYAIASDTLTIRVTDPQPVPPTSGGAESNDSNGASPNSATGVTQIRPNTPTQQGQGNSLSTTEAGSEVSTAGNGTSVGKGLSLPPAPLTTRVEPIAGQNRARVTAILPKRVDGAEILRTVVVVRDQHGKVVSRVSISVTNSDSVVSVDVPFSANGYTVSVYNVNNLGVSTGGLATSPLVYASTITQRSATGTPALFGTPVAKSIYFAGGSAVLDEADKQQLRAVAARAKSSEQRLFITGFARLGGSDAKTLNSISTDRAHTVASYLATQGLQVWIRYYGVGSLRGTGAPSDRRVEIRASNERIPRIMVK